jgi:hypothetical protein
LIFAGVEGPFGALVVSFTVMINQIFLGVDVFFVFFGKNNMNDFLFVYFKLLKLYFLHCSWRVDLGSNLEVELSKKGRLVYNFAVFGTK